MDAEGQIYQAMAEALCKHYTFTEGMLGTNMFYEIKMSRPPSGAELAALIQKLRVDLCMINLSEGCKSTSKDEIKDACAISPIKEDHEVFVARMMKENSEIRA